MGKDKNVIDTILIHENKNIDVIQVSTSETKANINKDKDFLFTPDAIFNMKILSSMLFIGGFINRRRKRHPTLIYVDGKKNAEVLSQGKEILDPLTNEESKEIVKRTMALGFREFKPISTIMFLIIVILLIIVVIEGFIIMGRIGVLP